REGDGTVTGLKIDTAPRDIYLAAVSPEDELLGDARRISSETLLIALGIMVASIPVAWLLSRLLATPLRALTHETRAVRDFDFTSPPATQSVVAEVDELALSMKAMRVTIRNFLDIAATISAERNFQRLLDHLLSETIAAAGSAAGAIYLLYDKQHALRSTAVKPVMGGSPALSVVEPDSACANHPVRRAVADRKTLVVP